MEFEEFIDSLKINAKLIKLDEYQSKNDKLLLKYHKENPEQLLVFEDWWLYKKDIIKSILTVKSGKAKKYYARKLEIKEVDTNTATKFLDENHLQGNQNASIKLGLFDGEELIQVMTFSAARFNKVADYELLRLATKKYCTVVGGAERLWKHFIKNNPGKNIVSYSDNTLFSGGIYKKLGFFYVSEEVPGYCYYNYNKKFPKMRYHRAMFQKAKLAKRFGIDNKIVEDSTEYDICENFGLKRIWDCGQTTWMYLTNYNEHKYYYIYEIKNNINGKTYVGQHRTNNLKDGYFGSGIVLEQAIKKYGKENFTKTILEEGNAANINALEKEWIKKYKSENKAEYNIAEGGSGYGNPFAYKTEEEKREIYKRSGESRKGKPSNSMGKTWKKSIPDISKNNNAKEKLGKPVIIMETEQEFKCAADCAEFLGVEKSNVSKVCRGTQQSTGGFHICYKENYNKENNIWLGKERGKVSKKVGTKQKVSEETYQKILAFNKTLGKPVRCIETGEIFESAAEAARKLNLRKTSIIAVCNGRQKTTGGLTFEKVQ